MKSNFPNLAHAWAARRLDPDKMDALNNTRYKPSRRSNRRTSRRSNAPLSAEDSALANNSKPSVEAASYKSVLSSRPLTAAGSDVPVEYRGADDRGTDSYPSLMFSEQAWNPPDAFLALAPRSKSLGDPLSVPLLDADDEEFFSTLFDEVLNDAEQFTVGMGTVEVDVEVQSPFVPSLAETLEPFEISNVLYIASPEIRDLVSRYPTRMKQELDENDVVQLTNATMTQSMITSEDIERTNTMMTQMLRSFDLSVGDAVQASQRKRVATTKTGGKGTDHVGTNTNNSTNAAQLETRNAGQNHAGDMRDTFVSQTPGDVPGLPLDVCATTGGLASPSTFDTFTQHRASSQSRPDDWIETLLTISSPNLLSLCDVKLLISPTISGGAKAAL